MRILKKITAVILVISMVLTLQGGVFIQLTSNVVKAVESANELKLPYYIESTDKNDKKHVKRLREDENEYMAIFENEDGSITCYSFLSPVQFRDANGNLVDYDTRLKEVKNQDKKDAGYSYEIASSDASIMMPQDVVSNKYITVEKDKYKIDFKPISLKENSSTTDDKYKAEKVKDQKQNSVGVEYLSNDSDNISYRYYALSNGAKEEIILNSKPESNVFQFEYKFKNIIPELQEDGRVLLLDEETSEVVGAMDSMFMYDSFTGEHSEEDGHYSESIQLSIEKKNDNKYIFTVTLDHEFLDDPDTVYPVIVDPTLTLDDYPEVKDVHTAHLYPTTSYYNTTLNKLGRSGTYGKVRTFIQPYIPSGTVYDGYEVTSATFSAYNYTSYTSTAYIDIYPITSSWSHSSTKWNNMPSYNSSTKIDTKIFNARGRYNFDITELAQNWQKYANDTSQGYINYGFIVRERYEDGSRYRAIYTANYGTNSYVVINYVSEDLQAPNDIASLTAVVDEDVDNNGRAKVTLSWPQTSDNPSWHNDGVKEYELTLTDAAGNFYNADGTMVSSATPENYTPITITHDGVTTTYSQEFVNLTDNTTYEAKIRACDHAAAVNWTGYTSSGSIAVGDMLELTVSVIPNDWTMDTTPTLSWTEAVDTDSIYYSINDGIWTDTGYLGVDGSCDMPAFTQDGQYQIKIKGMDASGNPSAQSSAVTYKLDTTAPVAAITNLANDDIIADRVDIIGEVSDVSSGIASWILEYGEGDTPTAWTTITTGTTAINLGDTIYEWDTSLLVAGVYTIRLTSTDTVGLNSAQVTVKLTKSVSTTLNAPTNLTTAVNNNYMAALYWEDGNNPVGTKYEVYRGTDAGFTPDSNTNMIAEDVSEKYWYDFTAEAGTSYYYKIIAVDIIGENLKEISTPSAASDAVNISIPDETDEMLGLQNFWKYSGFSAGNSVGYINVANGNLVFNSTDSVYPGYMLAMVMRRTYNSQSDTKSALGYGWDFSYNTCLYKEYDANGNIISVILKDGDGSLHEFDNPVENAGITTYDAPKGVFMDLSYNAATGEYTIVRKDYVTYTFNEKLQLIKLAEQNGNYLKFHYDELGKLETIENRDNADNSKHTAHLYYYQNEDDQAKCYTTNSDILGLLGMMVDEGGREYNYTYIKLDGKMYLESAYLDIDTATADYTEEYTYTVLDGKYNLATITDANGNATTVTYTTGAKVQKVDYPDPDVNVTGDIRSFTLNYDVANTTTVKDDWLHSTTYEYNSDGCVTKVTNALGEATNYTYNTELQVTSVSYDNFVGTTWTTLETTINYNSDNNIQSIVDAKNNTTSFTYDSTYVHKVDTITKTIGSVTTTLSDNTYTNGRLTMTEDAEGNKTEYTYTSTGLIETATTYVTDGSLTFGTKTYYTYDANGWLNNIYQGKKDVANASLPLISRVVSYDAYGNPTVVEDAMGNQSKVVYDALGRPEMTYLPNKDGATGAPLDWENNKKTEADFDLKGNVLSTKDIKGLETIMAYDGMDRLLSTTVQASVGDIVSTVSYETYQKSAGNTCLKVVYTDPVGYDTVTVGDRTTIEYYDELGRVIKTSVSDGTNELERSIVTYDSAGNVKTTRDLIDGTGGYRETTYEYDELNRLTKTKMYDDDNNLVATTTTYDDLVNKPKTVTDAEGSTTTYTYDKIGRLTQVKQYDGTQYLYTNYSYDNIESYNSTNYLMNCITDAKGHVKETYLNEYGLAAVEINQGDTTTNAKIYVERTFNMDGTMATMNQAAPNSTNGTTRQTDYYTYNNWGQVDLIRYGSATSTDNQTDYAYNDHGQMSSITDSRTDIKNGGVATYTTSWTYDDIGRVESVTQDGVTIYYDFNNASQITELRQPADGSATDYEATQYEYDNYGRVKYVRQSDYDSTLAAYQNTQLVREYDYLITGQINYMTDYLQFNGTGTNTMVTQYDYTDLGQIKQMKYTKDTSVLEQYDYEYDLNGNIDQETMMNNHGTSTSSITKVYTYDPLGRLTKSTEGSDTTDYTYDKTGNRTYEKSRQTNDYYDKYFYYTEFDQLYLETTNIDHGTNDTGHFNYDDRGGLIYSESKVYNQILGYEQVPVYDYVYVQKWDENQDPYWEWDYVIVDYVDGDIIWQYPNGTPWLGTTYTYDAAGYVQKSVEEIEENTKYKTTWNYYNGMEQRTKKIVTEDGVTDTTNYTYSGMSILFTKDGNGGKLTENILAADGLTIASQRFDGTYTGKYYFFNHDIRNSVMSIVDGVGDAQKYYEYNEYGKAEELGNADFINENTFTGAVSEGGDIYYMNARFYDANTGRFLSQDTYKGNAYEPWSQNLYTYVGNNPINLIDPTGHMALPPQLLDGTTVAPKPPVIAEIVDEDDYDNGLFDNEDDAAFAFAEVALPATLADQKERMAIIMPVEVTVIYDDGSVGTEIMYTYGKIHKGMRNNVVYDTARLLHHHLIDIQRRGLNVNDPMARVSVVHTHPYSGKNGNAPQAQYFSGGFGDEMVARVPFVNNMYLAESETGSLRVYDESKPHGTFNNGIALVGYDLVKSKGVQYP